MPAFCQADGKLHDECVCEGNEGEALKVWDHMRTLYSDSIPAHTLQLYHPSNAPLFNLERFNQYLLYLLFKLCPSTVGRQDKQVSAAKHGRDERPGLEERGCSWRPRQLPRGATGSGSRGTTVVIHYTAKQSAAAVFVVGTHTRAA